MTKISAGRISGLTDPPVQGTDAVNQNYVDYKSWKTAVKAASTNNIVLSPAVTTIDNISISEGQRVLLKNQTDTTQNGIYKLESGNYVRTNDAQADDNASGIFVYVQEGSINGDKLFHCPDELNFNQGASFIQFDKNGVVGPGTSVNNTIPRYNGTEGNLVKTSGIVINDTNDMSGIKNITSSGIISGNTLTDGVVSISLGAITGLTGISTGSISASGTVQGGTITDGVATLTSGNLSGIGNLSVSSLTSSGFIKTNTSLILEDPSAGTNTFTLQAPDLTQNLTWKFPVNNGFSGQYLSTDGAGNLAWVTSTGTGNVVGPSSSTNNAIALYDGSTGKLIKNSSVTISSSNLSGVGNLVSTGTVSGSSLTDGTATLTSGNLTGVGSISASSLTTTNTVSAASLTDGTATLTSGNLTGVGSISASSLTTTNTVSASLTDGTATLTSGNLTGIDNLTASGTISGNTLTDGTATLTGGTLSGLVTPINNNDAANKSYVDSIAQGLKYKDPVKLGSVSNLTLSGEQTIDGVFAGNGDRILVKNQTNGVENGIYIVSTSSWSRSSDMPTSSNASGVSVLVEEGNVNTGSGFVCNNIVSSDIVGTDSLVFVQYSAGVTIDAGNGLSKSGTTLSVNTDNSTIEIVSDTLRIKDNAISSAKIATNAVTTAKILDSTITNAKLVNSSLSVSAGDGLQNGGSVSLGGNTTLSVNSTVLRTSGTQSISGITNFTNITNSSDTISGAVIVSGGMGVGKNLYVGENIDCTGTISSTTFSDGTASLSGGTLANLLAPTNDNDAANKAYVDALITGLKFRDPVKAASVTNLTLSGLQTVDAVSLSVDDRVLVKSQTNAVENGIYLAKTGAWAYATDYSGGQSAQGYAVLVEFGNENVGTSFVVKGEDPYTIGTSEIIWVKFASSGSINAGNGLGKSGSTLYVNTDNTTIEIVSDSIQVKNNSINSTKLANDGVTTAKILDENITTAKIAPNAVTTAKITDNAITNVKLQNSFVTINSGDGLQNGGILNLGSSMTLSLDSSVLRTTGNQNASGIQIFSNTTESDNTISGAVIVSGGLGVAKNINTSGNITSLSGTISGNTLTDGTVTITSGNITGISSFSANTINGTSFSDGTATLSGGLLTGLGNPTSDSEAATKGYVDAIAQGIKWKNPVKLCSIGLNDNHVLSGEQTIDGYAAEDGDRVLLKDQWYPRQNGIWIVRVGSWERASDMPEGSGAAGASVIVQEGQLNFGAGFVCNNSAVADTVGNNAGTTGDDLNFVQFTGAGSIIAGDGISKDGNILSVNIDDTTIGISFDNLYVKDNSIGTTKLIDSSITTNKINTAAVTNSKLANSSLTISPGDGLKNGGSVSLGGNVSLAVNSTVLRTSGDQIASGVQSFTNATQSTNINTGAVVISGGLGVTKNINTSGNIVSSGSVSGSSFTDSIATLTGGNLSGLGAISGNSLTLTGNISSGGFTDGTLTIDTGSITNVTNIVSNGNISGVSLTDGTATLSGGNLIGLIAPTDDSHAVNKAYADAIVVTAGNGLSKLGTDLNVNTDNTTIEIFADTLQIKDNAISSAKIATNAVTTAKILDSTITNAKLVNSSLSVTAGDGLQNGGSISLGGSTSLAVNSTVVRTTGSQSIAGIKTFSDTTQSTTSTTGAVIVSGGMGIAKNIYTGGNIVSSGSVSSSSFSDGTATLTGGNLTGVGSINISGNITSSGSVSGNTLTDNVATLTGGNLSGVGNLVSTGTISGTSFTDGTATLTGGKLSGLITPVNDTDATNKAYVDGMTVGLKWKLSVKAATTVNKTLSGSTTIDGLSLQNGDRILVKNQTNAVQNGVYIYNTSGSWSRSSDFNSGNAQNFAVFVTSGTVNTGTSWVVIGVDPYTIGTSQLTFAQFASNGALTAGNGLNKTGSTVNVDVDNNTIEILNNKLQIKDNAVTTAKLANNSVSNAKIVNSTITNSKLVNSSLSVTAGDGLQNGGSISLGGSTSLAVNSTVVRTTGSQSIAGIKTFSDITQSTTSTTGAVVVSGGIGIAKNIYTGGNIVSSGSINGTSLTDGNATLSGGNLYSVGSINCGNVISSGTVSGSSLTDNVATLTSGNLSGIGNLVSTGTISGTSFTDGTATLSGGTLSGLVAPTSNSHAATKSYVDNLVVLAGNGLTKSGTTISAVVDNTTIEILTGALRLMDNSITTSKLVNNSVTNAKILDSTITNAKLVNNSLTITAGDGLQNGGSVSLGGNTTLAVNSTILRTSGSQSASGVQSFTNTTNSTSSTTGAVIISGGLGVGGDTYTTGRIETNDTVSANTLTDGVASLSSGNLTTTGNLNSGNVTASDTVTAVTLTDNTASLNSGSFVGLVNVNVNGVITISPIPDDRILFTDNSGQITSSSGLTWDGTTMASTVVGTQNITRPNGSNQASLWTSGSGNIDIGLQTVGTIQMGLGPMLKVTSTTSILQSALTIQGNLSRQYLDTTINTAGNVTYTASEVFNGIIFRNCSGASRTDTLPTAEELVNIIPEPVVGSSMEILIRNTSTDLSLLTLAANTGITLNEDLTIAAGITSRFLIVLNNIIFNQWQATVFASVPKDRVIVQCSLTNAASGAQSVRYAQWGPPASTNTIDYTVLGFSGKIVQIVCTYTSNDPIGMNSTSDSLSFSIGTVDNNLSTFTPLTGGTDIIVWDDSYDNTFPATSSGAISIPISGTDRIAIRSVESNSVQPGSMEIRCAITIQLD